MNVFVVDFYATAFVPMPDGSTEDDVRKYVDDNWEKVTEEARRYMLEFGEFEVNFGWHKEVD